MCCEGTKDLKRSFLQCFEVAESRSFGSTIHPSSPFHPLPVRYMAFHAWRRCSCLGNFSLSLALSRNHMPCRVCERVSAMGGRRWPVTVK